MLKGVIAVTVQDITTCHQLGTRGATWNLNTHHAWSGLSCPMNISLVNPSVSLYPVICISRRSVSCGIQSICSILDIDLEFESAPRSFSPFTCLSLTHTHSHTHYGILPAYVLPRLFWLKITTNTPKLFRLLLVSALPCHLASSPLLVLFLYWFYLYIYILI